MADVVNDAAERIWNVYRSRVPCAPVRDVIGVADVELAYAVQETNTVRWLKEGRKLSGRKIGLTSKAVQQQLGVDQPDFRNAVRRYASVATASSCPVHDLCSHA